MTPAFGLFCNPESRRVEGFCGAVGRLLRERPVFAPWLAILEDHPWQEKFAPAPQYLRLESPGRNWPVEQRFLALGAAVQDEETSCEWRRIPAQEVMRLENDPGCIHPSRQWFLGWRRILHELSNWAQRHDIAARWLCPPEDVLCMFDKWASHTALDQAGVSVPPVLGLPREFDELWAMMRDAGRRRIFLKPCHGSSASGVVALETAGGRIQAFSTVERVEKPDGFALYNRRRIHTFRGAAEVRQLIDAVCRDRCIAQIWVPKAGLHDRPFDVRVVVIGGRARQVMVRLGRGPITNSQLLGGRGDADLLRQRMGEDSWARMLCLCERAMACFPRSLHAGFDVVVEPDYRTTRILEVNAFGDLLPRLLHEGRDTYEWEVTAALDRTAPSQVSSMGA